MKKGFVLAAAAAGSILLSGCQSLVFSASLTDHILLSGSKTRLTLEECSLVFLDFQTRYNLYYQNLGETSFWEEEAGESDFSDYLRDGRIREELCTLVLLNDMAPGLGVSLTDADYAACKAAAADYYSTLSQLEKEYVQGDESDAASLYEKYRVAQKTVEALSGGIDTEISDNDKRVMILQLIVSDSQEEIERAQARIAAGEDFETVASQVSRFSRIEYQVSRGTLNPILEDIAFYMRDGEVSDIIRTEENYYIIKCIDDFDRELSEANESAVLDQMRLSVWSGTFAAFAEEHPVAVSEEIWNHIRFYQTAAMTSDDLFETYHAYVSILE